MASSSSSSSSPRLKHQVFLSFRGEDTRHNFTSHLLESLKGKGLDVFFDEQKLEKGEQLSQALIEAIAASNISIIVLSVDYASSKSCLTELSEIMDRKRTQGQIVLPIFYHVNPSDVRNIGGSFETSFGKHKSKRPDDEVLKRWKNDFAEVGTLKGWHIEGGIFDRSEPDYLKDIGEYVIKRLYSMSRRVSEQLVGIEDQKEEILRLIEQEDSPVIGIWGMGGIGKTTLADAAYNEVSPQFDDHWFLQNIREKLEKHGRESLRNVLLSELLKQEICIDTPSIGCTLIQERLNNKRVFVVLDDVHKSNLIEYFGVKHFGHGSKTLVTSRDQHILIEGGVVKIYEAKALNKDDSLQLFCKCAFKQSNPPVDFWYLSMEFVKYARGNPLALKVLGSNQRQRSKEVWKSALDRLRACPETEITKVLMISYDDLDQLGKDIFLDIACFFNGVSELNVKEILCGCYPGALEAINILVDKYLLDGDKRPSNIFPSWTSSPYSMHDLLKEMGRDIVQKEDKYPGNRTRLWRSKDGYNVLKYKKGTEAIEGIMLNMSEIDALKLCPNVFENMINLRVLKFYYSWFVHRQNEPCDKGLHADQVDIVSLPDELRLLWWDYYPFKSLSSNFNPKNLVVLHLVGGKMEQLWNEDPKDLGKLRYIDLVACKNLKKIPNLFGAINLERLTCGGCESLVELPCLSDLTNLRRISLDGCKNLRKIPNLSGSINLEIFSCFECESLVELPCFSGLTNLSNIALDGCKNLRKIPNLSGSINLEIFSCRGCESLVELPCFSGLTNLRNIALDGCKNLGEISNLLGAINLNELSCSGCESLVELPCFKHMTSLVSLNFSKCRRLKKFPEVPYTCSMLDLEGTEIEEVSDSIEHLLELRELKMGNSRVKNVSSNISKLESLNRLDLSHCPITKFPEISRCLSTLDLSGTQIEEVPSYISMCENLLSLNINHCKSLKLLSELPPRLEWLDAHDCTSLEKVSFKNQYPWAREAIIAEYPFIFSNCSVLNQDSIDSIVANALLRIESLAKRPAIKFDGDRENPFFPYLGRLAGKHEYYGRELIYCFPGKEISSNKFKPLSPNSSIVWKRDQTRCSGSRLVFALCLVADLKHYLKFGFAQFICDYQLKTTSGDYEMFRSIWQWQRPGYLEDHVWILYNGNMVKKDEDYEEASFEFYTHTFVPDGQGQGGGKYYDTKVQKFGVHVFYVDDESSAVIDVESSEKFNSDEIGNDESDEFSDAFFDCEENFDFEEDAIILRMSHDDSAAKMRPGHKRSLSCDEGERWPKRLK